MTACTSAEQPENALYRMSLAESGSVRVLSAVQSRNASSPMVVTPAGMVIDVSPLQPEKT